MDTYLHQPSIKWTKNSLWTQIEDDLVVSWVLKHGPCKWKECSEFVHSKTFKQCRDRWFYVLDPNIKISKRDKVEDYLIFKFYKICGKKWSEIAKYIPGRNCSQIKNRFNALMRGWKYNYFIEDNCSTADKEKVISFMTTFEIDEILGKHKLNFSKLKDNSNFSNFDCKWLIL